MVGVLWSREGVMVVHAPAGKPVGTPLHFARNASMGCMVADEIEKAFFLTGMMYARGCCVWRVRDLVLRTDAMALAWVSIEARICQSASRKLFGEHTHMVCAHWYVARPQVGRGCKTWLWYIQ
jgi:hypothetical protein